ncbi:Brevis radix (BRX) domain [Arabidopsis thaliana x Arabidopsis arenosa]|uniref:Brevis radix (BRX) domain n=1 Tax=Arabidopsis thaliana x Arabidopsis arenosa TaxID=1240361 RepID=A0A8T1XZ99_9BRAS|nr:Brevis radix (BRX) domain [Arabidopsis thaliana x Arabidopsis arenosa]
MFSKATRRPVFHSASYRHQANHAAKAINQNITRAKECEPHNENEWVEQSEPGVYITTSLTRDARDLKCVRLSRKWSSRLAMNKQKSGGQRTEDAFVSNTENLSFQIQCV